MAANGGFSKPSTIAKTEDTSSSSDKKAAESLKVAEEEEDAAEQKPTVVEKGLSVFHLTSFGFNLAEEAKKARHSQDQGGTPGIVAAAAKKKNRNQNVVYGGGPSDVTDFGDDDDQVYPVDDDDDDDLSREDEEEVVEDGDEEESAAKTYDYFNDYSEADDMWEDEEEEEGDDEEDNEELELLEKEAFEAAVLAAEEERERLRELRLIEIRRKKELLIERYQKVARVMINHRKKNIFLQDYLYHLASRKGVLRGDNQGSSGQTLNSDESEVNKGIKRRAQRKNAMMAARFARFLRKTGHFYDDDKMDKRHHHYHNRHDPVSIARSRSRHMQIHHHHLHMYDFSAFNMHHQHRHHHHRHRKNPVPVTLVRKDSQTCPEAKDGKPCPINRKTKSRIKLLRSRHYLNSRKSRYNFASHRDSEGARDKPRTLQEILEEKAAATIRRMLKSANEALEAFERHRCRMAKKKQLIKITKLLERQYNGTAVQEQERHHLVSFVETSVKAQNLAKKKALRRQQKNKSQNKTGVVNLNHQWIKSLERIRELRLKKAKLEQEQRLLLMRKVRYWHIWESRAKSALEAVHEFVTEMAARVNMSRGEALMFRSGIDQFQKQLYSLHETMLHRLVRKFKAESTLNMIKRRAKDNENVAAPTVKGFTMTDYERMIIENQESHQKLDERQAHLLEQYEKLKRYIRQVAENHLHKQRSWGALRTGRHDMKQLWELCSVERDNLLRKLKEISRVKLLHSRLFMQISVLENKRLFKNFQQVTHQVTALKDIKRNLQAKLYQTLGMLRVLDVRYKDTTLRTEQESINSRDKGNSDCLQYCRKTIRQRIGPRVPNTIYSVDECGNLKESVFKPESIQMGYNTPTKQMQRKVSNTNQFRLTQQQSNKLPRLKKPS